MAELIDCDRVARMTFTTRPELRGTFGMVASTHWLASAAGMSVLERGGNAFDAAVAAGFTLQVVEPHLNGPGGEVPAVFWSAERGEPLVLCGQGVAPAAATIERFRALGHDLIPGTGVLAACVPGAFGGWLLLLRDFGTWRLEDVLAFAIGYADDGYPVVEGMRLVIERETELLESWPASRELYLPPPEVGTRFRNAALAATYRRIVDEARGGSREDEIERARRAFYEGFVAEEIHRFCEAEGGLLTGDDLASWEATVEPPASHDYRGITVCKTRPWGSGPVALQQLALLEGFDLAALSEAELVHVVTECAKLAFADRDALYGDTDVPLDTLLSRDYNDARRALVADDASAAYEPGPGEAAGPRRGRPDGRLRRADPRRHGPPRRGRPVGEHGLGDAERRLAAELAGDRERSAGRSARGRRCSGWRTACPRRSVRAPAPGRRSHPVWHCARGSPGSPGARRAATSRSSGRCTSSSATSTAG